jgi:chromosomal replication initiator protein
MVELGLESSWNLFIKKLEDLLGNATVRRWILSFSIHFEEGKTIVLSAQDAFQALWFEEHLKPRLHLLKDPLGRAIPVILKLPQKTKPVKKDPLVQKGDKPQTHGLPFQKANPCYTFDRFLPFDENTIVVRLLDEACSYWIAKNYKKLSPIVASHSKTTFAIPPNPIFLTGPTGSGKTHLLTATANRLRQSGLNVILANADTFSEHVVKSMRAGEMTSFRALWRKADVLIIEDVQEFSRKTATQEEFFHTFNTLQMAGKQIFLSANCFPQMLQQIEARLISRFEWGIVLPLSPLPKKNYPSLLEARATALNFPLSQKVSSFLSESFASSPKALCNALSSLVSRLSVSGGRLHPSTHQLSLSQIENLLADLLEKEASLALSSDKILKIVAEFFGITTEDLLGTSQSREYTLPRQITMFLIRKHLRLPYLKIADYFKKNHSTVMSATKQIEKHLKDSSNSVGSSISSIEIKLYENQTTA